MELSSDKLCEKDFIPSFLALNKTTQSFIDNRIQLFAPGVSGQELHKKLHIPFLKLILPDFNHTQMLKEAQRVEARAVGHRSKDSFGWKSLCLHGIESDKTLSSDRYGFATELEAPYRWTDISSECPETKNFLQELLDKKYFEKFFRVRFMYLEPTGRILFHQDRDDMNKSLGPLNIALNMPEGCHWVFKKWGTVPFEPGTGYAVDISNQHGVWNFSNETRIHLILHGRYGENYYRSIEKSVDLKRQALLKNPQQTTNSLLQTTKERDPESFDNILWQYAPEISHRQLLSHCTNITEHFLRLKANRRHSFTSGIHLSKLLAQSSEKGSTWAFVSTPGTMIKDGFFSRARSFLKTIDSKVFIVGHLLDRKERWFGLHPQAFFINLKIWEKLGRPAFGGDSIEQELPYVLRSDENIHDDYTPLFLTSNQMTQKGRPQIFGWNWVRAALRANYTLINFSSELREKKQFLYPEQNQEILLERLNFINRPLSDLRQQSKLSPHQEDIFEELHIEAFGLDKKIFLFNTEQVRSPYQEGRVRKIDVFVGLPAGFMDLHLAHRHQLNENARFVYFDINPSMLEIKKEFFSNWSGTDFPAFWQALEKRRSDIFENKLMTVDKPDISKKWEDELTVWGSKENFQRIFETVRPIEKQFISVDIISSYQMLLEEFAKHRNKHIVFWYSNCFNYTPSLALSDWNMGTLRASGTHFLNSLYRISKSNNLKITLYGEDVIEGYKIPGFGTDIENVFA